ncbi:MAG: tetratricopeptide repeat protein [Puniceicoccales bacterium]|jgi:tetratricopeptide (TPR) repeat protein|nr:tetratricopeptide repeat protein [Puniceicoccales bacterium]
MPKVTLSSLDPRLQKQVASAEKSLLTNPLYTVEVLRSIVQNNPECLEVRRLLRKAQKRVYGPVKKGFGSLFSSFPAVLGASKLVATAPLEAIKVAEKLLDKKPTDSAANKLLASAAEKLAWFDTAAFAYEEASAAEPKNLSLLVAWGTVLIKAEDFDAALNVADEGLKRFPGNGDLQEVARRASVAKTLQKGKWEAQGDFKEKTKDLSAASQVDVESRIVQDIAVAVRIAAELEQKIAADPENVDYYREAIRNYQTAGDLDKALDAIRRARQTNIGRADAALEKQENEISLAILDKKVETIAEQLAADPENDALRTNHQQAVNDALSFRLQIYKNLVERYPNDYSYRYSLGVLLLQTGSVDEAIQQLQVAQRNPRNRHNAMLHLARAFVAGNKFDLAVEQLQTAKSEILPMNDTKKEIIYELGSALEKVGREKEAIDEYKALYMNDSSYRDVSAKINAYYAAQQNA